MPSEYVPHYEVNVSEYTALRKEMDTTADRICERDKKYHTGGTRMVLRMQDSFGRLRLPDNVKAVME